MILALVLIDRDTHMGTRGSFENKLNIAFAIIRQCWNAKVDIDEEKLISMVMLECRCERRKAREIISAIMTKFNYVKENKKYLYKEVELTDAK